MVPALYERFRKLSDEDMRKFESYCQVVNRRPEFGQSAASLSQLLSLDKEATD